MIEMPLIVIILLFYFEGILVFQERKFEFFSHPEEKISKDIPYACQNLSSYLTQKSESWMYF